MEKLPASVGRQWKNVLTGLYNIKLNCGHTTPSIGTSCVGVLLSESSTYSALPWQWAPISNSDQLLQRNTIPTQNILVQSTRPEKFKGDSSVRLRTQTQYRKLSDYYVGHCCSTQHPWNLGTGVFLDLYFVHANNTESFTACSPVKVRFQELL